MKESDVRSYPDGIDRTAEQSEKIWSECYAVNKNLRKITAKQTELEKLKTILFAQNPSIPVMIANSHKKIYDFICEHQKNRKKLTVINIDAHHDMFNDNPELDCGNWLSHISEKYKMNLLWIANPTMLDIYGFKDEDKKIIPINLDGIKNINFDAVFLCRSDTWTPPHLDKHFAKLCGTIKHHFDEVDMEPNINIPRDVEKKGVNNEYRRLRKENAGLRRV